MDRRCLVTTTLTVLCLLATSACGTQYQKSGFSGGYSETKIQDGVYKVTFRGNGYTGRETVANYALLRCAEVTLQNGFKYFIVHDGDTSSHSSSYSTPMSSTTTGIATRSGNTAQFSGQTQYYGGNTFTVHKSRSSLVIQCFNTKPNDPQTLVYDASEVRSNLRTQYKIRDAVTKKK